MNANSMQYRQGWWIKNFIFDLSVTVILVLLATAALYPFWNTVAVSFNDGSDTVRGGIYLLPRIPTMRNYQAVFAGGTLWWAFFISVAKTLIVMTQNVFFTSVLAYALSRKEFVLRRQLTFVIILTMYVGAGLIPQYMLYRQLGLLNKFLVYFVPNVVGAFNFIVIRTYMRGIPESLAESAKIDGAGEFRTFFSIIFPLCKPVLATVALFVAVGAWNSWFDTKFYASGRAELSTLQYELMKLLSSSMNQTKSAADIGAAGMASNLSRSLVTPTSIRAAITVVASLPILLVYPLLQRYFVTGLNVGSIKE